MVQVMIRLQNHGKRNHPYWWIVVQPKNKNFRGRIIERVGIWAPRKTKTVDRAITINTYKVKYWLSVGATPTDAAHRLLHFAGLLPRKPVPFGSKFLYPPKTKQYSLQYFHKHRWGLQNPDTANTHHYNKIKEMESILKAKLSIDNEAINEIVRPRDLKLKEDRSKEYNTEMNTDDINSDDFEFYSRKRNFDIVSKKLNKYFETKYSLYRGNDYSYNNYLRKLEKLSKHESLDAEGFKEYLNCVKNLNESKNKVLQNISQHFLNELLTKESMSKEISELIKLAKANFEKDSSKQENDQSATFVEENKKFLDIFLNAANKDTNSVIDALTRSFDHAARGLFKVSEENHLTDKEFQDVKNLRIAKILIKLRVALLKKERKELFGEEESVKKEINLNKEKESLKSNNFFSSVIDNINSSKFSDVPIFDKDLISEIIVRNEECENYDDLLFNNINKYILSTSTFQKFKPLLFNSEFYGSENISNEQKQKILSNPNIYLLSNDLIDEVIKSLLQMLKKKYDVNEVYRDEEKDLNQFEKDEIARSERRSKMNTRLNELKKKYGEELDVLYADLKNAPEYKDVYEFRREFDEDMTKKFDVKFKKDFRMVKPEYTGGKYFSAEEIEEEKAREAKVDAITQKVEKEIEAIRLGLEPPKPEAETPEEDRALEEKIRSQLMFKTLGYQDSLEMSIPLPEENHPIINFNPFIGLYRRKHKKDPKVPHQDEIMKLNKRYLREQIILANSIQETQAIPVPRQKEIMKRFLEYFGKYNDHMYPDGFRHYENFEVYNSVFPLKTIADYQGECKKKLIFLF